MSLTVACGGCQAEYNVGEAWVGKTFHCNGCGKDILVKPVVHDGPGRPRFSISAPAVIWFLRLAAWSLCFVWSSLLLLAFFATMGRQTTAIQESAVAGVYCFLIIFGYVLCRCVDSGLSLLMPRQDNRDIT